MKKYVIVALTIIVCLPLTCSKKAVGSATGTMVTPIKLAAEFANQLQVSHAVPRAYKEKTDNAKKITYAEIEWVDLMPKDDFLALENRPAYLDDIEDGSADDSLTSQFKNTLSASKDRYHQALNSKQIRPEFNQRTIRIPGFIVPLEFNEQQTITTFFLVPYFGACLHMPPPPPNQIIYAEYEPGIRLDALYDPFWIEGTLSTTLIENEMATAAYAMHVVLIESYAEGSEATIDREP